MMNAGLEPGDLFENSLEARLGEDIERRALNAETLASRFDLMFRFFAGTVENRPERIREMRRGLQQQRGFADTRFAADQHERTGTTPPPRTRSNSSMPDDSRSATTVSMSAYNCGPAAAREACSASPHPTAPPGRPPAGRSSTSEFHAPQSAQRPSHFCDCAPHSWQPKTVLVFIELCQLPAPSFQLAASKRAI